jgi:CDP-4-dehydro-6-deoxyglucose reductase
MILLAGGTGFAPIKAIVEHAIAENCQRPMFIYWGAKARSTCTRTPCRKPGRHSMPTSAMFRCSPPAAGDAWTGRTGFVHQAVLADLPIYPAIRSMPAARRP